MSTRWNVVTGGGGGMGLACARRLAKRGPVLIAEFDEARLESALTSLRGEGIEVTGVHCDVSRESDVRALAEALHRRGPLWSVVHTAGLSPMMAPADRIYDVNLVGTAHITEAFLPLAEPGSACVCISSMAGHSGEQSSSPAIDAILDAPLEGDLLARLEAAQPDLSPGDSGVAYRLSKWGVQRRVRREARAWGGRGARIVSLSPGIIDTPMGQFENKRQPVMKEIAENTPLARMGTADEIAAVAAFLCSEDAAYVTGVDWLVDGGATHGFHAAVGTGHSKAQGIDQ